MGAVKKLRSKKEVIRPPSREFDSVATIRSVGGNEEQEQRG